MNLIGIMQGRLLKKLNNLYQAHPIGYWHQEFPIAKDLKLDCIQFILDFDRFSANPLLSDSGISEILEAQNETNVRVDSICADFFMKKKIFSSNPEDVELSLTTLKTLINYASRLDVTDIIIPFVDESSLKNDVDKDNLIKNLEPVLPLLDQTNINLSFETDLPPRDFYMLLKEFNHIHIKANYDTGNSASLGYDVNEEFSLYGDYISNIHIKDRVLGGGPCFLGTGNTNFKEFFDCLKSSRYEGSLIFQAYRDDEGIKIFKDQFDWILPYLNDYLDRKGL